jgi:peptidoglycan/xylan/chitin deacetylase (PgdA/CDA1 family)
MSGSKQWLEAVTGQVVTAFCYPAGANNAALQQLVKETGYTIARTVDKFAFSVGDNPFAVPTTIQIYPYPLRPLPDIALWRGWRTRINPVLSALPHIRALRLSPEALFNWHILAKALFDEAHQRDGIWHLWGHSWEIERYGLWDALDHILKHISAQEDIVPVTNSALLTPIKSGEYGKT